MCMRGCSKGRVGEGGGEQTLLELLLHIKPKGKQSSHLPSPKRLPLLVFLCVIGVYILYCKSFHAGKYVKHVEELQSTKYHYIYMMVFGTFSNNGLLTPKHYYLNTSHLKHMS